MFFSRPAGLKWGNRGDIATVDYDKNDLTADGEWNDLDLSSIVPPVTKLIRLKVEIQYSATINLIAFKKKDYVEAINIYPCYITAVNVPHIYIIDVPCDTDRTISYSTSVITWGTLNVTVLGWFK